MKPEYIIKVGNVTVMTWEQYKLLKNKRYEEYKETDKPIKRSARRIIKVANKYDILQSNFN